MTNSAVCDARPLSRFLKMAIVAGVESAVRIHINRGDNLNARDDKGRTPLMLSAERNKPGICQLLIDGGADDGLLDSSGKDAHAIAIAAGAYDAALVIEAARSSKRGPNGIEGHSIRTPTSNGDDCPIVEASTADAHSETTATTEPTWHSPIAAEHANAATYPLTLEFSVANEAACSSSDEPTHAIAPTPDSSEDEPTFDLLGWEAEENGPPPDGDPTLSEAAVAIQSAISEHEPIDTSADWDDFEAYLPERSSPLPRADDAEARARLRLILLRAVREGSVPESDVEDMSLNDDGSENKEAEALLRMTINDLGAEADERFEYTSPHESFEVFIQPEETPDEEEVVSDALTFIDDLTAHRNDPLRIYQKEFQRETLLTAVEEVTLGQAMETGLERALDALAAWPSGINQVLAAAQLVKSGAKPLRWISSGPREDPQSIENNLDGDTGAKTVASPEDGDDEDDSLFDLDANTANNELADFIDHLTQLSNHPIDASQGSTSWGTVRGTLASLRLTRSFLLELADAKDVDDPEPASAFAKAMKAHQSARERMTIANLKLVFSIAKKYLYSGQPLDDLIQEGNIGLLKAVERYDWRRGFKFSTYATWWIRQQVGRFVADKGRTIRLPVHVYEKTQRIARESRAFEAETGRAPTVHEVAARLDMQPIKVAALIRATLELTPIHELCVDEFIAVDARSDFISRDPMDIVSDKQLLGSIDRVLATLKRKDERILRMRFGIGVQEAMTLDEIGIRFEVTRERIRQIEAKALRLLRHPSRIVQLNRELNGNLPSKTDEVAESNSDPEDIEADEASAYETSDPTAVKANTSRQTKAVGVSPGPPKSAEPTALDRLLSQALELGIPVDDDRKGPSGTIWVNIIETSDLRFRKLVRKLLALGFEFWPRKGYWR